MYGIKENRKNEINIKKSRFITYIYSIDKIEEIEEKIKHLKEQYKDAKHCCYAYIFDSYSKASDDNEPSKTAGIPILEVLKKNNLNRVLCVVIRYFGGIKLGAGGLIRAYSTSCKEVLINNIVELEEGYLITIDTTYEKEKLLTYLIKEQQVIKKEYKENVHFLIRANRSLLEQLKEQNIAYQILENIQIEKSSNK